MPKRRKAEFRGTVSFASLNAHNCVELARRDDLWSFYFTALDFFNEKLEWREQRDYSINQVKDIKTRCFKYPQKRLWVGPTKNVQNLEAIFAHIDSLDYADEPDYEHIRDHLVELYNRYEMVQLPLPTQLAPINAMPGIPPAAPPQKVWALISKSAD